MAKYTAITFADCTHSCSARDFYAKRNTKSDSYAITWSIYISAFLIPPDCTRTNCESRQFELRVVRLLRLLLNSLPLNSGFFLDEATICTSHFFWDMLLLLLSTLIHKNI